MQVKGRVLFMQVRLAVGLNRFRHLGRLPSVTILMRPWTLQVSQVQLLEQDTNIIPHPPYPPYSPYDTHVIMAVNGDSLYRKAETTLNSKTGWFSGVSKEEKLEVYTTPIPTRNTATNKSPECRRGIQQSRYVTLPT